MFVGCNKPLRIQFPHVRGDRFACPLWIIEFSIHIYIYIYYNMYMWLCIYIYILACMIYDDVW